MNDATYLYLNVAVMALVTYLLRMIPLAAFRKKIKSRFLLDFLYYVPYAVLSAMTIPAVFYSGNYIISAAAGVIVACVLAFFERGLLTVAACACAGVALTELVMRLCGLIR